jgi:hypothetical protein
MLTGYGCGFCPQDSPIPEVAIQFRQQECTLYHNADTTHFRWTIDPKPAQNGDFQLQTNKETHVLNNYFTFCSDYMFFDHRAFDGPMMLFVKK